MKKTKQTKNKRCDSVFSFAITSKTKDEDPVLKERKKRGKLKKDDSFVCPGPKKSKPSLSYLNDIKAHCLGNDPVLQFGEPRIPYEPPKYLPPKTKKYLKEREEAKKKYVEDLNFCKHLAETKKMPECPDRQNVLKITIPSPEQSEAKVKPRPLSPTTSTIIPIAPNPRALELKKPKSGIIVNAKRKLIDYDSFDLVYRRKPRPGFEKEIQALWKKKQLADIHEMDVEKYLEKEIEEMGEEEDEEYHDQPTMPVGGEEPPEEPETELTKVFKREVEQMSQATSYQAKDYGASAEEIEEKASPVGQMTQKFRRSSEFERFKIPERKIKRGTLESHSYTKMHQDILKDFFYGTIAGTMHQASQGIQEGVRNQQGLTMPVCAYCYAFLKHPSIWEDNDLDIIVEAGNNMYMDCLRQMCKPEGCVEVLPSDLPVYCHLLHKKIRFTVTEPLVTGMVRSDQKTVYNLSKGVRIFFSKNHAGIFQTKGVNLAIWRDRYYYFFDAKPRTRDLYPDPEGTAMMANFYDLESVITVLLDRCFLGDWPFALLGIEAYSIHDQNAPEDRVSLMNLEDKKAFDVFSERKAVVQGSFELTDKCFEYTRNKQALAIAISALVYSRISQPNSWYRKIVDKIMIIGNQLYIECFNNKPMSVLKLEQFPAEFTFGPYSIEIYIKPNMYGDYICKKGRCILEDCLMKFFESYSMAVLVLGDYTIAVWKQRGVFYCFDPYSRNEQGYASRNGVACVSMHTDLDSLTWMLAKNHCGETTAFYIHALMVCKIVRVPHQDCALRDDVTIEDLSDEQLKKTTKKKSDRLAVGKEKTIQVQEDGRPSIANEPDGMVEGESLIEVDSEVGSLELASLPRLPHVPHVKIPLGLDDVPDLDSPSLSDTQIKPPQMKDVDEEDLKVDIASYQLTMDELAGIKKEEEGEGDKAEEKPAEEKKEPPKPPAPAPGGDQKAAEGEGEFYMAADRSTVIHATSFENTASEMLSAELSALLVDYEVLEPTNLARTLGRKRRAFAKDQQTSLVLGYDPEPDITQSEELRKPNNFIDLPDNSQIIRGFSNMADLEGQGSDLEYLAPFVCIMAAAVAKKFSLVSWSGEVVEYVLKCGQELYKASKFRYDQVARLDIPKISLGSTDFHIVVDYLFDTLMKDNILEVSLDRLLFTRSDCGIFVTPAYACAIFYRHHLYYLYDGYGNNEVGLSEGKKNTGKACMSRFKDLRTLVQRIVYNKSVREGVEPVEFTRFVLSRVEVIALNPPKPQPIEDQDQGEDAEWIDLDEEEEIEEMEEEEVEEEEEDEKVAKPKIETGWRYYKGVGTIRGSKCLKGRGVGESEIKQDHFACICACLMLMELPLDKWDNLKVDFCLDQGKNIYDHADDLCATEKRIIKNVLIRRHFFDIIVKKIIIINYKENRDLSTGIDTLFKRRYSYFIVQLVGSCHVIYKGPANWYYMFDPYAINRKGRPAKEGKAGWIKLRKLQTLKRMLRREAAKTGGLYSFYTFEVTSIRRAPKGLVISHQMHMYELDKPKKKEKISKPFHEEVYWLNTDPIPWSRKVSFTPNGQARGCPESMWYNWDVEYPNDLFSMTGTMHQASSCFPEDSRGKQTLCNLVLAIGMTQIYELKAWSPSIIDSILVNGDDYCNMIILGLKEDDVEDYELSLDDLKKDCQIFPYTFKIKVKNVVDGTMFLLRSQSFNLYKGLRYFFDDFEKRFGVIVVSKNNGKRQVAFGKTKELEYFMFDCETVGTPMFVDGMAVAYVLRMTTLNRLLHVLTLTLRGGDFFIYEVKPVNLKPMS